MKAEMSPMLHPRRGGPVEVGNVYSHPHGRPFYKIVLGIIEQLGKHPWNNVVLLHIAATGEIVGCSRSPIPYISNHNDLVGKVKNLPNLKIEWLKEEDRKK